MIPCLPVRMPRRVKRSDLGSSVEDENGKMGYIDLDGDYVWREK